MLSAIGLALSVGSQLFGAVSGANAARANRRFARRQAREVLAQGEEAAQAYQRDLAQLLGQQRVGAAAQGIDVGQGSVAQIRQQTETYGAQDIETIRANARRQAWGIRTQANLDYRAGMNQAIAGGVGALGQLALDYDYYDTKKKIDKAIEEGRSPEEIAALRGGQTLLGRARNAWDNYIGRRTLKRAAQRGTFTDPSWF